MRNHYFAECTRAPTKPDNTSTSPTVIDGPFLEGEVISYICNNPTQSIPSNSIATCTSTGNFDVPSIPSCVTTSE